MNRNSKQTEHLSHWQTTDLGLAAFIVAHGLPISIVPGENPTALCRFASSPSDRLDEAILNWGRGGQVEAAVFWGILNDLKRRIHEARRDADQP